MTKCFEDGRGEGLIRDEGRVGDWMQVYTGKRFYPLDPREEDISIFDIAHSLAHQCRYNGHSLRHYSVAEHSVEVSRMVEPEHALQALLHDASEAYIGDMVRPLKRCLGKENPFFQISDQIERVIFRKFGCSEAMHKSVEDADSQICIVEREVFHPRADEWNLPFARPVGSVVRGYNPMQAELLFLTRYCLLTGSDLTGHLQIAGDLHRGLPFAEIAVKFFER